MPTPATGAAHSGSAERLRATIHAVHARLDRHGRSVVVILAVTLFAMLVVRARAKHFWHDEIYTILASQLPIATLWHASRDGLDLAPPLNTILTGFAHALLGVGRVSTRLPAMVGFVSACVLLFAMVRRRSSGLVALSAALLPCFTMAFPYAYEARGYALTAGAFALALFAWSEAAAGRHRNRHLALMAIALSAGVWAHYYALLAVLPIAVGELVRQIARSRVELAPWAALTAAGAGALPLVPLATAAAPQAAAFWTRLEPARVVPTYQSILGSLDSGRFRLAAAAVIVLVLAELFWRARGLEPSRRLPAHEVAAGLVSLVIPAVGALIGMHVGVPFIPRYVLFAVVGFALVVPLTVWRLGSCARIADVMLCLILVVAFVSEVGSTLPGIPFASRSPVEGRPLLAERLAARQPVVLSGGISYLELWYHLGPDDQRHAVYLADPKTELRETRSDTIDRGYLALARWTTVPIFEYDTFVSEHRAFHVYVCGRDWLTRRLRDDGAQIGDVRREAGCWLYHARLPAS